MYKAIRNGKIIAISEKRDFKSLIYDVIQQDKQHTVDDYENYEGEYVLKSNVPVAYQNEQIRQKREERYEVESDPLRLDYDEALARGEDNAESLKQQWLASKDLIRQELPYIEE